MRKAIALGLLLVAGVANATEPTPLFPLPGYVTGNEYRTYPEATRVAYVAGAVDGFMTAALVVKENIPRPRTMHDCITINNISAVQLAAIVDKFLNDHPERWGNAMGTLTFAALADACTKDGTPF